MKLNRPTAALTIALAALLVGAASAQAGSMVYIQARNVFLANDDATHPYQVTLDGNTSSPYRSPTEADDGTIVAAKGGELIHLAQSGAVLSHFVPDTGGYPLAAAISPDGTKISYNYSQITQCVTYDAYSCGYYPEPGAAITSSSGRGTGTGDLSGRLQETEWIDNNTLVAGEDSSYVAYIAGGVEHDWFAPMDDFDVFPTSFPYPELPVVSRSGKYLAVVLRPNPSGGNPSASDVLAIWKMNGLPPAKPTPLCAYDALDAGGFQDPHFLNDDAGIAWSDNAGIEATTIDAQCQAKNEFTLTSTGAVIPSASQASFSVAANNPGPRPVPAPAPAASGGGTAPPATAAFGLNPTSPGTSKRSQITGKGIAVSLGCSATCHYTVSLLVSQKTARSLGLPAKGKGMVTLGSTSGTAGPGAQVHVKLTKKARTALLRRLHPGQTLHITLEVQASGAAGATTTRDAPLRVKA